MQVCYPTTPAQYFHLLRRQIKQDIVRPLIVMTPKSLLRLPAATSEMSELTSGGFRPVIDDARITDKAAVRRIALCSGKVFYDLDATRHGESAAHTSLDVAVIRLEQFYPFPGKLLQAILAEYQNAAEIVWTQEEPQNMGGWAFVEPRLRAILPQGITLRYVGRTSSASPSTGNYAIHHLEKDELFEDTFGMEAHGSRAAASESH